VPAGQQQLHRRGGNTAPARRQHCADAAAATLEIHWRSTCRFGQGGSMPFSRVSPDDDAAVAEVARILEAARDVDDPDEFPVLVTSVANQMRYGFDMEPEEFYLYRPSESADPLGVLQIDMPTRDNLHLIWAGITVHPDHRRRGHGSALLEEALRRGRGAGRTTMWVGLAEDDAGTRTFVERRGFRYASHDARRRQVLAEVDHAEIDRLYAKAQGAAAGYALERLRPPTDDAVLEQLIEVSAAINDAPMGDLTYEDEKYDLERVRDYETARALSGDRLYRVIARRVATGEIGGHTVMIVNPRRPTIGHQADTAVARSHRGHRLGLLLKIDALRWLAQAEPQLELVETWNNVDNRFMIDVNEALGYQLNRVFATFELTF
jgi:GNAT superfamily N-acetyltransferase